MNNNLKKILPFGVLLLLSGCVSLENYQKMTPTQRAQDVCQNNAQVNYYHNQINQFKQEIREINTLLSRGYSTRENCTVTTYEDNFKTNKEKLNKATKRVCTEVIIPVSNRAHEFKENKKFELIQALQHSENQQRISFDECFARVLPMSAKQAYNYRNQ